MKNFLLMTTLSLTLVACERQDRPNNNTPANQQDYDYDNTEQNVRDRDSNAKTPFDQSESSADRTITQKIRQAIMADSSLSTDAKTSKSSPIKVL